MRLAPSVITVALLVSAVASAQPLSIRARTAADRATEVIHSVCIQCHGRLKTSGLDLRVRDSLLKGGRRGAAVVPGRAAQSRLYRMVAGLDKPQMPPAGKLNAQQISALKEWIDGGAQWPRVSHPDAPWPYGAPARPAVPSVKTVSWVRNPIDSFVLSKIEAAGLRPAPPANRTTLIRRACFDLIGLPPKLEEVETFVNDRSPDAYPKLIDRLLASPHYGERWARHWLDLARYAESEGFKSDEMRPNAWRYRDYVIKSLNDDKPYDRFIREQIAGDELYPDNPDALVATGFCRHWADESNARNLRLRRQEILNDITETVGSSILGLTFGCARCHDHKYDPIPQRDYYRLQAYFAAARARDDIALIPAAQRPEYDARLKKWEEKTATIREAMAAIEAPVRKRHYQDLYKKFPPDIQEAIDTPAEKRNSLQWILFRKAEAQLNATDGEVQGAMKPEEKKRWNELKAELDKFAADYPGKMPICTGIQDIGPEAPKTFTLAVGVYDKPIDEVQPAPPTIMCASAGLIEDRKSKIEDPNSTGRRSALAEWLTDPTNPLTARVMANRIWQHHFGLGIVGTPSDFGNTGEKPSNRELLDWLAVEFIKNGWSMKKLHRLIMLSNTYQQAVVSNHSASTVDPENRLLWSFRRQRLEGEVIRDAILSVSGELNAKMGGPGVMAPLPKEVTTRGYWKDTDDEREASRRSIYLFVKRNLRYPLFQAFDMPDTHEPCARRECSTTAPQALMLLNDGSIVKSAQRLAGRVVSEAGVAPSAQVERAYRLTFGRPPDTFERERALAFLNRQAKLIGGETDDESPLLLPQPMPKSMSDTTAAALVDFCHALINANEFLYIE